LASVGHTIVQQMGEFMVLLDSTSHRIIDPCHCVRLELIAWFAYKLNVRLLGSQYSSFATIEPTTPSPTEVAAVCPWISIPLLSGGLFRERLECEIGCCSEWTATFATGNPEPRAVLVHVAAEAPPGAVVPAWASHGVMELSLDDCELWVRTDVPDPWQLTAAAHCVLLCLRDSHDRIEELRCDVVLLFVASAALGADAFVGEHEEGLSKCCGEIHL